MKPLGKLLLIWILIMFVVTFTCLLTDLTVQQALRLGANAQPVQLAKDTAIKLQSGKSPESISNGETIDIAKSLDTFVMIYNKNGQMTASTGTLNGQKPPYPKGVFEYTAKKGEDRVTWQTQNGLRFATVALKTNNGYVVAARSLFETENLIDHIGRIILMAWAACLVCSAFALGIIYVFIKKVF